MSKFFKVLYNSKKSKARLGEIKIDHGVIKTPSFVPVGTKGTVKSIPLSFLKEIGVQVAFVNTYHLVTHPGVEVIEKAGGIHKYSGLNIPLMSDSGGFQIFSLARKEIKNEKLKIKNYNQKFKINNEEKIPTLVKIYDDGVKFRSVFDGTLIEFTPEKSMDYQSKIGADIIMAFDECIYYGASYQYTKEATERTHQWLLRCLNWKKSEIRNPRLRQSFGGQAKSETVLIEQNANKQNVNSTSFSVIPAKAGIPTKRNNYIDSRLRGNDRLEEWKIIPNFDIRGLNFNQYLYGIIQGGVFEDLRKESAQFVVSQEVDGVAIGGVSVGESKRQMRDQVAWVSDYLPKDKPVHLLGVGQVDDILDLVKYGVDTFDCVEPTRLGRMGTIYQIKNLKLKIQNYSSKFKIEAIDILRGKYRFDLSKVDENCDCYVCQNFTKSYLHHLFKTRELLAYSLATYHNLWVMERFFEKIRGLIERDLI